MDERMQDGRQPVDRRAFPAEEHPKNRAMEPEDPMAMAAASAEGHPMAMLDGIVEEYARMGWDAARIRLLFDRPFFRATYALKQAFGEAAVHRRIEETLARCGVFRVRSSSLEMFDGE